MLYNIDHERNQRCPFFFFDFFKRKAGFADPALTSPTLTDSSGCCLDIFVTIRELHCCCCWWSQSACFWAHGHELRQARAGVKPRTFCVWVNQRDHVLPSHLISLFVNTCCSEHGSRQLTRPLKRFATQTPSLWNLQRTDRSSSRAQTWLSCALTAAPVCQLCCIINSPRLLLPHPLFSCICRLPMSRSPAAVFPSRYTIYPLKSQHARAHTRARTKTMWKAVLVSVVKDGVASDKQVLEQKPPPRHTWSELAAALRALQLSWKA